MRRERQREVAQEGRKVEDRIIKLLHEDEKIRSECIIGHGPSRSCNDFVLEDPDTGESVKLDISDLKVPYRLEDGEKIHFLMDADVIVYHKKTERIICVISVKKSFRERGAQAAYWAVKTKEIRRRRYKYILVTPDVDNELYDPSAQHRRPRKWRVILTNEMDTVFVIDKKQSFRQENFYVGNEYLKRYIKNLIKESFNNHL